MAVFCHQCGAENPDWASFCDQCGTRLIHPGAAGTEAETQPPLANPPAAPAVAPATTTGGATTCEQCGNPVLPGEAFCDNCGAPQATVAPPSGQPDQNYPPPQPFNPSMPTATPAAPPSVSPTQPPTTPVPPAQPVPPAPPPAPPAAPAGSVTLSIQIPATQTTVALPQRNELTVGRADPISQFYPDLDLTPFGGIEHGVGRRHLRIVHQNGTVAIEDLDSTNGTYHNGTKLPARQQQPIQSGDEIRLGNFVLHIVW